MRWIRKYLSSKPHMAFSIISLLGFISFVTNFIRAISDGNLDANELHQLTATAEAFSATLFFALAIFFKNRPK